MIDELRSRCEAPAINGRRVFVTVKALRARGAELGYSRWILSAVLVKFLRGDIIDAAARKVLDGRFEPDGSIVISSADRLGARSPSAR